MARHGFIMVLDALGLTSHLSLGRRVRASRLPAIDAGWPDRIRMVLADMGPTYVKLGQLASTRSDVLPKELIKALEHLQDDVPPVDYEVIADEVQKAWGVPLTDKVAHFDPEPMAAASIGQVHKATLFDGRHVVIKVRRPGIIEKSEADFQILRQLAAVAERRTSWGEQYGLTDLVEELTLTMRDEMDFVVEARNTEMAQKNQPGKVRIPDVVWSLTRPNVLVLEAISGIKISDREGLLKAGIEPSKAARQLVEAVYQQIFVHGFFHADPHPGNVHIDKQGELIFLDWGLVGTLSSEMRRRSVELVLGLARGESTKVVEALLNLGAVTSHVDRPSLLRDVERLRRRYYEVSLQDFQLGEALSDLFVLAQHHHIRIPPEYMLLAKSAVTVDGVVRALDPAISLVELGKPLAMQLIWEQIDPRGWGPEFLRGAGEWGQSLSRIPYELQSALATLSRGEVRIVLERKSLEKELGHWERLVNRFTLTLLLAALLIGTGLVVHRDHLDRLSGGIPFGEYLFIGAAVMGLWILVGALRRGKL